METSYLFLFLLLPSVHIMANFFWLRRPKAKRQITQSMTSMTSIRFLEINKSMRETRGARDTMRRCFSQTVYFPKSKIQN
eukprot:scaffold21334_cov93-Skeletonema_marinoi.AAC.2